MVQLEERESICSMLRDTLKILIKNGLTFKHKFNVEGLLGITVDDGEDVFLVSVNELVKSELQANQSLELEVETIEDQELSFMAESSPSRRKRKRRRNTKNPESVSSDEDVADALLPNEVSPIGQAISLEKDSKSTSLAKSNSSGFQNITIKQEIDEESWLEENQDYATEPSSADQSLMDSSQGVSDMYDRSLTDQMPGPSGSQEELFDSYGLKQNKNTCWPEKHAEDHHTPGGKCEACTEKETNINDLEGQIDVLKYQLSSLQPMAEKRNVAVPMAGYVTQQEIDKYRMEPIGGDIYIHSHQMASVIAKEADGRKMVRHLMAILLKRDIKGGAVSLGQLDQGVVEVILNWTQINQKSSYTPGKLRQALTRNLSAFRAHQKKTNKL